MPQDPNTIPFAAFATVLALVPVVALWWLWILRGMEARRLTRFALALLAWCGFVTAFGFSQPLEHTRFLPLLAGPLVIPPAAAILWFAFRGPASVFRALPLASLTLMQVFRLPLELFGLHGLYLGGVMPRLMTYEGGNLDILIGLSAPLVATLIATNDLSIPRLRRIVIAWNIGGLMMLGNVVLRGVFSIPSSAQLWAFDTPNLAVTTFPFAYIPGLFVMSALAGDVFSLRALLRTAPAPSRLGELRVSGCG